MKAILLLIQSERSRNKNQSPSVYLCFDSPKLLVSRSDRGKACCCMLYVCAYAHKIIHHSYIHKRTHARTCTLYGRCVYIHSLTHTHTYTRGQPVSFTYGMPLHPNNIFARSLFPHSYTFFIIIQKNFRYFIIIIFIFLIFYHKKKKLI